MSSFSKSRRQPSARRGATTKDPFRADKAAIEHVLTGLDGFLVEIICHSDLHFVNRRRQTLDLPLSARVDPGR